MSFWCERSQCMKRGMQEMERIRGTGEKRRLREQGCLKQKRTETAFIVELVTGVPSQPSTLKQIRVDTHTHTAERDLVFVLPSNAACGRLLWMEHDTWDS